jgi:hypothetical protein
VGNIIFLLCYVQYGTFRNIHICFMHPFWLLSLPYICMYSLLASVFSTTLTSIIDFFKGTVSPDIGFFFSVEIIQSVLSVGSSMASASMRMLTIYANCPLVFSNSIIIGLKNLECHWCSRKKFPKATSTHINRIPKAAGVDNNLRFLHKVMYIICLHLKQKKRKIYILQRSSRPVIRAQMWYD